MKKEYILAGLLLLLPLLLGGISAVLPVSREEPFPHKGGMPCRIEKTGKEN